jgi:hypothetical protein
MMSAADFVRLLQARARLVAAMDIEAQEFDALIMPTTKIVAPLLSESTTPEGFNAKQALIAGNTGLVNFLDLCAISLPIPRAGGLPVGLMLVARNGHDQDCYELPERSNGSLAPNEDVRPGTEASEIDRVFLRVRQHKSSLVLGCQSKMSMTAAAFLESSRGRAVHIARLVRCDSQHTITMLLGQQPVPPCVGAGLKLGPGQN